MSDSPQDPLDPLLERWGRPPPFAPLMPALRQRLHGRAAETESLFAHPAFAAVFVAACVLLGLFLAEIRVSRVRHDRDTQLLESYRRLIDPLVTATPPAAPKGDRT
ncbi:MAG: hypothetical protein HZA32_18200 [Opitutae bacterium]|nr:hypothetical protein [Opitutae bacterium]